MHNDATGRAISKGSYIAYVVTTGSSAGIKFGAVTKLNEKKKKDLVWNNATQNYEDTVTTNYSVQIVSVDKSWPNDKWELQGKREGRAAKVQAITRLDRIILLDPNQMPPNVKEILDQELHFRGQI